MRCRFGSKTYSDAAGPRAPSSRPGPRMLPTSWKESPYGMAAARPVETVERLADVARLHRDLTRHGRMRRFLALLVAQVHARITDDELVMDGVVVVDQEAHDRAGSHVQRRERELAVVDADVD